jgi:NAD-dependent deacetylase
VTDAAIERLAARLAAARRLTVLTGAGVSAASGVPTFRGAGGLWRRHRPEDLATPEAFARDPRLVWEWYDWRRQLIARCAPNPAHEVLARWERARPGFTLITQNVDGLHERAGSACLIRLHGSIWQVSCARRCPGSNREATTEDRVPLPELPPPCPWCGGLLRPAVVWFGEPIESEVMRACDAALACDVFLAVGTSSVVYPAAGLAHEARRRGAFTAELNLEATEAAPALDLAIQGRAEELLPAIDRRLIQSAAH